MFLQIYLNIIRSWEIKLYFIRILNYIFAYLVSVAD